MTATKETTLEIDLGALAHNYRYLQSKLDRNTKFMGVVKAFAYGNDSVSIAKKLVALGVDYLAVAYTDEGVRLREAGIEKPILIFHPQPTNFKELIDNNLIPTLYSPRILEVFMKAIKNFTGKAYPIHLNLNTGMNRLGLEAGEIEEALQKIKQSATIYVDGIYSHFAASDVESEQDFTKHQIEKFKDYTKKITISLDHQPLLHLCNTSGILNYPEAHFDMVRAGIGLYGFGNSAEEDRHLKPIGRLKTIISQIHHLQQGETVSYNRHFRATAPTSVATLPLGYADGFHRQYGNGKTHVCVKDQLAPVIGDVCMDMIMIDVTDIECQEGDEVIIFGRDQSAASLATEAETISYEILTAISQRVTRKVVNE